LHALAQASAREIGEAFIEIAETLSRLSEKHQINHRDLKPSNLYRYGTQFVIGDFGLARRPDDPTLTHEGKAVGPYAFLPSEVSIESRGELDWEKVDVFCLAMTL
jgi:serine/threonine protein kinase